MSIILDFRNVRNRQWSGGWPSLLSPQHHLDASSSNKLFPPAKPPLILPPTHSPDPARRRHDAPGGEADWAARPENRPSPPGRMRKARLQIRPG
jgi:hypothetical protein